MPNVRETYQQIQDRYGFSIPAQYREMFGLGFFHFDDLHCRVGPKYLRVNDMEWLDPAQIRDHEFPNYCLPGFVPFAVTAGADHWCWYPAWTQHDVTPVVLCPRDSAFAEGYAPDFVGSIFRQMLEYCFLVEPAEEADVREQLRQWQVALGSFLPARWSKVLADLRAAPLSGFSCGLSRYTGLLTEEACGEIVRRELAFPHLDTQFRWMEPSWEIYRDSIP